MNLLPVPRHVDLLDRTVAAGEPRVHVGAGGLPAEGYAITIGDDGDVSIDAADAAGAFYAHQTLAQLAHLHDGELPVGRIRDWPDLPVRAVMLDVARDKVPTMDTLLTLVDRLASWKVNQIQLYSEHTFAYRDHEVVWRDASPITAEEIRAIDARCRARHIELVPNQNCLGHMGRWLQHDAYRPLAMAPTPDQPDRAPTTIEPTNPAALALVRDLLAELLPNFSSPRYVNVGLDEPWELPPERIDDYLEWVRVLRALPELGDREMLIWGDILGGEPERIATLPDGVTVCEWGYDAGFPFDARAATYEAAGRPCWTAPGTSSWLTILGRVTNMRADITEAVDATLAHGGDGILNTDWGDQGHLQYLPISDPGLAYGAAVAWCASTNRDLDLGAALSTHCYDDPTGVLGQALIALGDLYLGITPQMGNVSALVLPLYWPQLIAGRWPLKGADADEYGAVGAELAACRATLARAQPRRVDGALVLDELQNAIALVSLLARDGSARVEGDGSLASIPEPTRRRFAAELQPVIAEHERLWLARNRPGGLTDSLAWLRHLEDCYESGTADFTWNGVHT
ncbi:MAG TPA: glycoside hydrolase family 20 zincin-like fold domain-containing protein [Acidimicrobiia bacterium]